RFFRLVQARAILWTDAVPAPVAERTQDAETDEGPDHQRLARREIVADVSKDIPRAVRSGRVGQPRLRRVAEAPAQPVVTEGAEVHARTNRVAGTSAETEIEIVRAESRSERQAHTIDREGRGPHDGRAFARRVIRPSRARCGARRGERVASERYDQER